jgi:N-acetylglucosaminyldiphosphoundecaprenol N-acetyl-beta-D-mannosaminyltransferase
MLMMPTEYLRLGGVRVDRVDMRETLARIETFIEERTPHRIVTVNLEYLRHAHDLHFQAAPNAADIACRRRLPLVWLSRLYRHPLHERIAGVDLADRCAWLASTKGYRVFLLGAGPGVAQSTASVLSERYSGLDIAGTYTPPLEEFSAEEEARIDQAIASAQPDILLVALPTPRQELWNHANARRWNVPVVIGVGAAFDMLSGEVNRAPAWMQHSGLEWLFRLVREPRRLWKRYLVHDAAVLFQVLTSRVTS